MKNTFFILVLMSAFPAWAEQKPVTVGVATVLSGDLAGAGDNVRKTIATYEKHYQRRPLRYIFEDSRLSSVEGLRAYQALINLHRADFLVSVCTSNGTVAAKEIINRSRIPLLAVATGGDSVDSAGEYVFRLGNSDSLNGVQQADRFIDGGRKRIALLTEETEYTNDISRTLRARLAERSPGALVFDEAFLPQTSDFRSQISAMKRSNPDALFVSTQTGVAFGVFVKQLRDIWPSPPEVHTNFLVAANPDARTAAGGSLAGVKYMAAAYDEASPDWKTFLEHYTSDHKTAPLIPFHAAGVFDALTIVEKYLGTTSAPSGEKFHDFLLNELGPFAGLMGAYRFDRAGNTNLGFVAREVTE